MGRVKRKGLTIAINGENATGISLWNLSCLFNPLRHHWCDSNFAFICGFFPSSSRNREVPLLRRRGAGSARRRSRSRLVVLEFGGNRTLPEGKLWGRRVRVTFASPAAFWARRGSVRGAADLWTVCARAGGRRGRAAGPPCVLSADAEVRSPGPFAPSRSGAQVQRRSGTRLGVNVHDCRHQPGRFLVTARVVPLRLKLNQASLSAKPCVIPIFTKNKVGNDQTKPSFISFFTSVIQISLQIPKLVQIQL